MASKTSMAYHAYQAKSPMNQGKVEALRALLPVWRAGLTLAMSCWTRPFVQSGVLPVLLQCLFDRFGSVFPQCGLMVFPGVVIVSR